MRLLSSLAVLAAGAVAVSASGPPMSNLKPPKLVDDEFNNVATRDIDGRSVAMHGLTTFDQLLNHSDPSQGTFRQRYWWNTEYWAGPGSPVVFFTPGEEAADDYTGYLTNQTITGQFAQAIGGAVVMVEHRYWGESSPFSELTTKNLRFLTLANSIADTTYFARNVALPFDNGNSTSNAPAVPWVMSGGSYSGALTAWVEHVDPGTFWAYHATSAVVQAVEDFWQYFEPIRQGLPQNCSTDVQRVVRYVDDVLANGTDTEVQALKDQFGLGAIEASDDFATALAYGPWQWQSHDFDSGYSSVYQFCDYVENSVTGVFNRSCRATAKGVGVTKALAGYAKWTADVMLPGTCAGYGYFTGENNTACFDTYNASSPIFTDTSVSNTVDRQWIWLLCNEPFAFWQDGAPTGEPSIVSRLMTKEYSERQCGLYFPPEDGYTYGQAAGLTTNDVNTYTGGWSVTNRTRLIWANGELDPWKHATVSSDYRPGGALVSTTEQPVHIIPGGIHCSDMIYANGLANASVMTVIQDEIAVIKGWVDEFYKAKKQRRQWTA